MMCVAVLAGVGLDYLLKHISGNKIKILLISILVVILGLEFAFIPQLTGLKPPAPVYTWLAKQKGDFIVAEYPLVMSEDDINYDYMFNQRIHSKRLVNGASPYSKAEEWRILLSDISDPGVPALLSYLKVKYVIFHPDKYRVKKEKIPNVAESGLKPVETFNNIRVYEVTAEPAKLVAVPEKNFDKLEKWGDEYWRWMSNDGKLSVTNSSAGKIYATLQFKAKSFAKTRMLKVIANGEVVGNLKIPWSSSRVFEVKNIELEPGKSQLILHSSPDAQVIDSIYHNYDMRKVSITFDWLKVVPSEQVD